MKLTVPFHPFYPGSSDNGIFGQVPVKTIAADRGKENKPDKMDIDGTLQEEMVGLGNHDHRATSNKKITKDK
jgi:hypothetical protein